MNTNTKRGPLVIPAKQRVNSKFLPDKARHWLCLCLLLLLAVAGYSQTAYLGDDPATGPQCHCLNNATTLDDGQFLDTITVSAPAGENWRVSVALGVQTNTDPSGPLAANTPLVEVSPGIYQLIIRHTDTNGFNMQLTNDTDVLQVGNTCYYPNVEIIGLPDTICLTSVPVALVANTNGIAGTGTFTIDGQPATIFNAQDLGPGTYTVTYTFDAGSGTPGDPTDPGCITSVNETVIVPVQPNLAVIALVNVTLGDDCTATITPDMVMAGNYPCMDDFIVTVFDQNGFPIGNMVTGANAGFRLNVRVMSAAGDFIGDGQIDVADDGAPGITCPPGSNELQVANEIQRLNGTIPANASNFIANNFSCYSDEVAPMSGRHYYVLNTIMVNQRDVYTIELKMNVAGGGVFGLYQGEFQPFQGPCQGIVGVSEPLPADEGFFVNDDDIVRLHVMLMPGMEYTLLTTTYEGSQIGDFEYAIYSQGTGRVNGLAGSPGSIQLPLYCSSIPNLVNNPASTAILGTPIVNDPCNANNTVTFVDELQNFIGFCGMATLTRTFTVTDPFNNSDQCVQTIVFPQITLEEVNLPPKVFNIDCNESFTTDANGNPSPDLTGYPFVITAEGAFDVNMVYCNILANYVDAAPIQVCSGTQQFIRTWSVSDNCNPGEVINFTQSIIIGDRTAPILTCSAPDTDLNGLPDTLIYSTQSASCSGAFNAPMPNVVDACSGFTVTTALVSDVPVPILNPFGDVIGFTTERRTLATILPGQNRLLTNVPVGVHLLQHTATDDCGNSAQIECPIRVEDLSAPAALCDDQINVSIGGNGIGNVMPEDIDEGSDDNCGPVTLQIRRLIDFDTDDCSIPATPFFTQWGPSIDLYCCEVGTTIEAELLVTDLSGLTNTCSTDIVIMDNTAPGCIAPQPVITTCADLPPNFDFDNITELQGTFGMAQAQDICGSANLIELLPDVDIEACGAGTVLRSFQVTDGAGNTNTCQQLITINSNTGYRIKFPKDVVGECIEPGADTVLIQNFGCDDLDVRSTDQLFETTAGACYKILRTYTVINWCEYDGFSAPIEISRNVACLPEAGTLDVWVNREPTGVAYIDIDTDRSNGLPAAGTKNITCDGQTNPAGYWEAIQSVGYWRYTQVIKVIDNTDPVVIITPPDPFCSLNDDCTGLATINFTVSDGCAAEMDDITAVVDIDNDGQFDQPLPVTGIYPDFQARGEFAIGTHRMRISVDDNCGNRTTDFVNFTVVDCKAVGLTCNGRVAVNLMPQPPGIDADGDGDIDVGALSVNVNNFVIGISEDCNEPIKFTLHNTADVNSGVDVPFPNRPALVVTCDDIGEVAVQVYAWDNAFNPYAVQPDGSIGGPNFATCSATLVVQDNGNVCTGGSQMGRLSGLIMTEEGIPVSEVGVSPRSDMMDYMAMTEEDGLFDFELQMEQAYTVQPYSRDDFDNGVTTFDIVQLAKHVLGTRLLDSPYKMIAADVNNSKSITTLDIIQIRKLILGIITEFPNNPSWRFVDANYDFPDPTDPWAEPFPEVRNVPYFGDDVTNADFIGVKVGDLNNSVVANPLDDPGARSLDNLYYLRADEVEFEAGDMVEAVFIGADKDDWVRGFQFTLQFDPLILAYDDIEWNLVTDKHLNVSNAKDGMIAVSWDAQNGDDQAMESFFSIRFEAQAAGRLSESIGITSRITKAEAYGIDDSIRGMGLNFAAKEMEEGESEFFLEQNRPNPFGDQTIIGFQIPDEGTVYLTIYDTNGKTVREYQQYFSAGYNQFLVDAQDIAARGLLYYKLETDRYAATKKMIILE